MIDAKMITTALELPGYRITRNLGVVRGIIVRSRSIVGNIGASLQTLVGGNISIYTNLCEKAREDAHRLMVEHAAQLGANAIIGARYDANEITAGVTEVYSKTCKAETENFRISFESRSSARWKGDERSALSAAHRSTPASQCRDRARY